MCNFPCLCSVFSLSFQPPSLSSTRFVVSWERGICYQFCKIEINKLRLKDLEETTLIMYKKRRRGKETKSSLFCARFGWLATTFYAKKRRKTKRQFCARFAFRCVQWWGSVLGRGVRSLFMLRSTLTFLFSVVLDFFMISFLCSFFFRKRIKMSAWKRIKKSFHFSYFSLVVFRLIY